jgi:hypothetical protein
MLIISWHHKIFNQKYSQHLGELLFFTNNNAIFVLPLKASYFKKFKTNTKS